MHTDFMAGGQEQPERGGQRWECYAHTREGRPPAEWEPLQAHLLDVAGRTESAAAVFNSASADWGRLAGLWHDLGKYSVEFQEYLRRAGSDEANLEERPGRIDHSTAGAQHAARALGQRKEGIVLAYPIAGHHAGLPDWDDGVSQAGLAQRLRRGVPSIVGRAPQGVLTAHGGRVPPLPIVLEALNEAGRAFRMAFWIRMLFSALVDSDFLATEAFLEPSRTLERPAAAPDLPRLDSVLEVHLDRLMANAPPTAVNDVRREVLQACRESARDPPGFFSLSVPTGGGKTLASMAFALRHARIHGLRRVIVAVPFTSIIEQNAKVYRDVFSEVGDHVVLEHHSNLDPERETARSRLASENWDAPVVVTTNVQLLESLFACRTSRCRKLHRVARSVVVLDEAQALPVDLLAPSLSALRELVESYGCTVVLCSATQPALQHREDFKIGLRSVRQIAPDPAGLHARLRRARIRWEGPLADADLAERLKLQAQVLCVVNTRPHAAGLFGRIEADPAAFHLSTRLCAAHRSAVLEEVRRRLVQGLSCRLVSTQVVEAGVDLDFPMVYRALGGLDSIAQAAGRCNREGRRHLGEVVVFDPEAAIPAGHLRQTADSARELLERYAGDLASPEAIQSYFELHYWKKSDAWDRREVLGCFVWGPQRMDFKFREAAERYRLITDTGLAVVVPWEDGGRRLVDRLLSEAPLDRSAYRKLQRYVVQIREHELQGLEERGAVTPSRASEGLWLLTGPQSYDGKLGLRLDREQAYAAEDLIV
ncbi:MAG: CRISPR-associated endonuclease Cas3'' [Planctomycetes bacterium]|nr:CRISPR-associated endonuclease Cas3'' [Planctomycetota bacterium]